MTSTSTRTRILDAAREHGWKVTEFPFSAWIDKGRDRVLVEFSVRGGVTLASVPARSIRGRGKAERLIAYISR